MNIKKYILIFSQAPCIQFVLKDLRIDRMLTKIIILKYKIAN